MADMSLTKNPMPEQDPLVRAGNFDEVALGYTKELAVAEAKRCLNCPNPLCRTGCPVSVRIPEFISKVVEEDFDAAYDILTSTNSLPAVCGRVCPQEKQCESKCVRGKKGESVAIGRLERFVADYHNAKKEKAPVEVPASNGHKIAVIGSGPSGLACADQLNQRGHNVTVYERSDRIGGLLMYGIPNMKLDKSVVNRRVKLMKEEGIDFITNADVGSSVSADEILNEYDAVVLCCGASNPRDLKVENREAKGVYFAVDFLKSTTKALLDETYDQGNYISAKGKKVVVVGGGDTGNDCVGTCIRHGCESVVQLEMMPKLPDTRTADNPWPQWGRVCKTDYGQQEAIAKFGADPRIYQTTVKKIISDENNHIKAIEVVSLEAKKDENTGRLNMIPVEGSERELECDLLLIAAGFLGASPYVTGAFGVETNQRTNVATEEGKYSTNIEKVFTAGDMHRGQSLVVWAISEGRAAAKEVDLYLMHYSNMI